MLLIGCTAGAFTACSDGDDDQKPSCPITEYTVPSTAEIGGFYTVTGKGFEASAQLFCATLRARRPRRPTRP